MSFRRREVMLAFCGLIFIAAPTLSAESPFYHVRQYIDQVRK
jgi:hypothetical protein